MQVLKLFAIASMPVLKVLLITALGSFLALPNVNILGQEPRKHINQVVFYVFNPALVGGNLAKTVTFESIKLLWFMPVNILITFIIGSALGWILIKITAPPQHLRALILGCCAAGNLGNLLLIIVPAICTEKGSPFGPSDTCQSYGLAYASLSMAIGAIFLWSYVYNIMRISSEEMKKEIDKVEDNERSTLSLVQDDNDSSADLTHELLLPPTESDKSAFCSWTTKIKQCLGMGLEKLNLKAVFAPSTTGAICGFIIGVIPQIRKLLIGSGAPFHVIEDSASLVGDAAIPITTLIIGGNLLKGLKRSGIGMSLVIGIIAVKYVMLPLLGIVIVKSAVHLGLVSSSDPLYQFILLLQFAVPPAMNIGTMSQLFGAGQSECSVILLWTYALASISLTLWTDSENFRLWGLSDLFIPSVMPVLNVLLITAVAVGSFLAIDHVDILGVEARKHFNNVVFLVFNPALAGSNLAEYITLKSMGVLLVYSLQNICWNCPFPIRCFLLPAR